MKLSKYLSPGYTRDAIGALSRNLHSSAPLKLYGVKLFGWVSDYIAVTRAGFAVEATVIETREGFGKYLKSRRADAPARRRRTSMAKCPNYEWIAAPPGLLKKEEIPEWAGLVEIMGKSYKTVKEAPAIHTGRLDTTSPAFVLKLSGWLSAWVELAYALASKQ